MASSNLLLFSFVQPRVWAWLVQGSNHGQEHPPPFIHTIPRINKEQDQYCCQSNPSTVWGLVGGFQLPHLIMVGARNPEFVANRMGFLGAGIYPRASVVSEYQDKLPRTHPGPLTHQRLLWVHKAPPMSSHVTELDQVKQRPPSLPSESGK